MRSGRLDLAVFLARLRAPAGRDGISALQAVWPVAADRLGWALAGAGFALDDGEALECWLLVGEQLAEREAMTELAAGVLDHVCEALVDVAGVGLIVDDRLAGRLPLLELAAAIATRQPHGRLKVDVVDVDGTPDVDGWATRRRPAALILLDSGLAGDRLAEVFAHELAHLLDPAWDQTDIAGAEVFANSLGPVLLAEKPTTVADVAPMVARVLQATCAQRRTVPAGHSLEDLLDWALEQASDWQPAFEMIAAHHPAARGVNRPDPRHWPG